MVSFKINYHVTFLLCFFHFSNFGFFLSIHRLTDLIIFRKVLGKLKRNLKEEIINQEITMKRNLAQIIDNWKRISKDKIINKFMLVNL